MPIIDAQVHAYKANTPQRPWHSVSNWPDHVTGDEMVAAMDTRFILDHLGLKQPRTPPAPTQPWADLPKVLELTTRTYDIIRAL